MAPPWPLPRITRDYKIKTKFFLLVSSHSTYNKYFAELFLRVSGIRDSILFIAVKNVFFTDIFIFSKILSNVDFEFLSKIFLIISDLGENLQKILQYTTYMSLRRLYHIFTNSRNFWFNQFQEFLVE